tara:strand:- start:144 stop:362 length:219 start_codon:yes stop_codon:yes gene_type:complete
MDDKDVIDTVMVRRLLAAAVLLTIIFILLWPRMDITSTEYISQMPGVFIMNIIIYALMIYPLTLFYRKMKKN